MKKIISWLEAKLFRSKSIKPPSDLESSKTDSSNIGVDLPKNMQNLVDDAAVPEHADEPDLEPDDQPSSNTEETT